jgi:hypothetical protein
LGHISLSTLADLRDQKAKQVEKSPNPSTVSLNPSTVSPNPSLAKATTNQKSHSSIYSKQGLHWTCKEKQEIMDLAEELIKQNQFTLIRLGHLYSEKHPDRTPNAVRQFASKMMKEGVLLVPNRTRVKKTDSRAWTPEEWQLLKNLMKNNPRLTTKEMAELFLTQTKGQKRGIRAIQSKISSLNKHAMK